MSSYIYLPNYHRVNPDFNAAAAVVQNPNTTVAEVNARASAGCGSIVSFPANGPSFEKLMYAAALAGPTVLAPGWPVDLAVPDRMAYPTASLNFQRNYW
jgi:hypothetical protein